MPDVEMQKFETAVEKLCADWALAVAKSLEDAREQVRSSSKALQEAIVKLPMPQKSMDADLEGIPQFVDDTVKSVSKRIKGNVELSLYLKMDVKKKKLANGGLGFVFKCS